MKCQKGRGTVHRICNESRFFHNSVIVDLARSLPLNILYFHNCMKTWKLNYCGRISHIAYRRETAICPPSSFPIGLPHSHYPNSNLSLYPISFTLFYHDLINRSRHDPVLPVPFPELHNIHPPSQKL